MRNLLSILSLSIFIIFVSCSAGKENEEVSDSTTEFQFEIVDSLTVDYLGTPMLCDISPNKERILLFNSRNTEFLITDSNGEILNQFSKSGDIPDNPGTLADRPIFYDDQTIVTHGQKGVLAYNLEGENVWKIERKEALSFWMSKTYTRSMYVMKSGNYFTIINNDDLAINASNDSLYENKNGFKIVNKETQSVKPIIPLEPFSRFLDGKGYAPSSMSPSNHVRDGQMVVSYSKDDFIYIYKWKNLDFELADTFSLAITPFFLDKAKDRDSFKNQEGFSMGGKLGEAEVRGVWFLADDEVLVWYNPGIKESERKEAKMESTGENSIRLVMPDNIPADQFQLYKEGDKMGQPIILPKALATILYIDDEFVWFTKDNEALGVEDDYAVFYKTKLKRQE